MARFDLVTNQDWESAQKRFDAFWEHEMLDRPCFYISVETGEENPLTPARAQIQTPFEREEDRRAAEEFSRSFREEYRKKRYYAEGLPNMYPNWEGISAMYGCKVKDFGNNFGILPAIDSIYDFDPSILDISHPEVRRLLENLEHYAANASGEGLIGLPPLANAGDTLAKIVGYTNLLTDLAEDPDAVIRAEEVMADFWCLLYDKIYDVLTKYQVGTCSWLPTWYRGRGALIEFDFSAMINPEHYERYLPTLIRRAEHAEKSIYHLDGTLTLRHIDLILGIRELDAIQWEPGVQCENILEWIPLMQKIQSAGKSLYVSGPMPDPETAKELLKHLSPKGLMMPVKVKSCDEAEKFLEDIEKMYR